MPLRIGLIGAGDNTRVRHIPGLRAVPDVEVVSLVNRSRESSERVAAQFGIPRVADSVEALLADPDIDAVCIGTWPYRHRDYTVAALAAGKHVLCEARMAANLAEAEEMFAASRAHPGLVAQLVPAPFDFRLGPTIMRMLREGAFGQVTEVSVTMMNGAGLNPAAPLTWRQRGDYSGHNVMMLGIFHETIQRWFGDTRRVIAHGRVTIATRIASETGTSAPVDIPDTYGVFSELADGTPVTYRFSNVAAGAPPAGISVYGTTATLHWTFGDTARWATHGGEWIELQPDSGTDRGWQVESDFVASVRDGAPVRLTNFEDGVKYMRFTEGAWQSWKTGRAVDL